MRSQHFFVFYFVLGLEKSINLYIIKSEYYLNEFVITSQKWLQTVSPSNKKTFLVHPRVYFFIYIIRFYKSHVFLYWRTVIWDYILKGSYFNCRKSKTNEMNYSKLTIINIKYKVVRVYNRSSHLLFVVRFKIKQISSTSYV